MRIYAILVEPEKPVNLGLIARLCENFEIDELRLVNPSLKERDWEIAEIFSSHAVNRVKKAVIYRSLDDALKDVELSIATSAIYRERGKNISRRAVELSELPKLISGIKVESIAVVFGRESSGLKREEIEKCHVLLTIQASNKYRTLNLACSAAIIFYVLRRIKKREKRTRILAKKEVREKLIEYFEMLAEDALNNKNKAKMAKKAFSNVMHRGGIGYREATLILGVIRSTLKKIGLIR
ncbi:hypothetical protein DRN86_00515 [Candidatus Geothermarchaeota archaeon]|nr:MAG: hypothetical protein DRN86_00515 [Candidatus Geothermarchaeota archaeon]